MDNLVYAMSKHLRVNQMQRGTKCSLNQRKFNVNDVHKQTVEQFNDFIKCKKMHCLLALLLLFAGGEAVSGVGTPPRRPSQQLSGGGWLWQGTDVTIAAGQRPPPLLGAGGGGSMLRRNLSASGAVASQLHWLPCNQTPPWGTGTVSPATPGNNQDAGSPSSWDDL